jgi:hypothetical protein
MYKVNPRMKTPTLFETVATKLLARQGMGVIWQLHLRAAASHLHGNWLAAIALIAIADAAERQWASGIGLL